MSGDKETVRKIIIFTFFFFLYFAKNFHLGKLKIKVSKHLKLNNTNYRLFSSCFCSDCEELWKDKAKGKRLLSQRAQCSPGMAPMLLSTSNYSGILSSPLSLFPEISPDFWRCFPICFLGVSRLRFLLSFSAPFGSWMPCVPSYFSCVWVTCQSPPSVGFSRQEYWSGLPFPSPGGLPDAGTEPASLLHWQASPLPLAPPGEQILGEVKILTEELERTYSVKAFFLSLFSTLKYSWFKMLC